MSSTYVWIGGNLIIAPGVTIGAEDDEFTFRWPGGAGAHHRSQG